MLLLGMAWQKGLVPLSRDALLRAIELNGVSFAKNKRAFEIGRGAAVDEAALRRAAGLAQAPAAPLTLEALIERRAAFLTDYQNAAYAARYRDFVGEIAGKSRTADPDGRLARAVAENLFKLMAYKDEYEVARLYAASDFRRKVRDEFDGDFRLKFHLAPPLLAGELDPLGRPKKREFGPWMMAAFSVLRRFKGLRGGPFDVFGRTEERRLERRLIDDYRRDIEAAAGRLDAASLPIAVELARLPEDIRGFGPVKLASIEKANARREGLLARLNPAARATQAA
jgi:indolepyruvate ferredoxin oxidoreductase